MCPVVRVRCCNKQEELSSAGMTLTQRYSNGICAPDFVTSNEENQYRPIKKKKKVCFGSNAYSRHSCMC